MANNPSIQAATVAAEEEAWNHTEDQHELTEHEVTEEMTANQKAATAAIRRILSATENCAVRAADTNATREQLSLGCV